MSDDVTASWANATSPMRSGLEDVLAQRLVRRERHYYLADANSQAMAELAATQRLQAYLGTPTDDAVHFADQLLIAAEDNFGAICRLVEHDAPVLYADKVLARAGIEACARAAWLLDPSSDPDRRAARGLTQRLATVKANADLLKESAEGRKFCLARRDEIIGRCLAAGLDVKRADGTAWVGDRAPSRRFAMRKLFGIAAAGDFDLGSFTQTWLSRFVHSDPAGLVENMLDSLPSGVEAPSVPGALTKGLAASSDRVNTTMAICAIAYVMSAGLFLRHEGWVDDGWTRTTVNLRGIVRASLGLMSGSGPTP